MTNVNKKYLDSSLKNEIWEEFLKKIKTAHSGSDLQTILLENFTPNEIIVLEKRLGINFLLRQNLKYREIQQLLDVSRATISFVKGGLKKKKKQARIKKSFSHSSSTSFSKRKNALLPPRGRGRWSFLYE